MWVLYKSANDCIIAINSYMFETICVTSKPLSVRFPLTYMHKYTHKNHIYAYLKDMYAEKLWGASAKRLPHSHKDRQYKSNGDCLMGGHCRHWALASCWSTRNDPRTGQYVRSIIVIIVWIIGGLCSCASSDFIPVPANSYSNNIIPTTLYYNGHTTMARHQRRTEDARSAGTTSIDKVVCSLMLVSISVPKAIDMCDAMRPSSYELLLF